MAQRTSIVNVIITVAVFIVLETVAFVMLSHNGALQNVWLSRGFTNFNAKVWGGGENIAHYFSLKKDNERLAQENYDLRQALRKYEEMKEHIDYGTISRVKNFEYIPASIVKHSTGGQRNYIIIDKGKDDGVKKGDGVITGQGVIGIVEAVSRHYSYVMSFNNINMAVSARIGRSGVIGPLSWDGISTRKALLNEIPHHTAVARGDTIYTSGYSSIFPPDVPLGLAGSAKIVNGASYEIKVWMFEDMSKVRYVTVVNNLDKEELEKLEQ